MTTAELLPEIDQFLSSLMLKQGEMIKLCEQKTVFLREGKMTQLTELSQREAVFIREMQLLLTTRQRLIDMASDSGNRMESLEEIVSTIEDNRTKNLLQRMDKSKELSAIIRRETWVHWIIAQKSSQHYGELIDIIAHCGNQAPSYAEGLLEDRSGSPLLDTTA